MTIEHEDDGKREAADDSSKAGVVDAAISFKLDVNDEGEPGAPVFENTESSAQEGLPVECKQDDSVEDNLQMPVLEALADEQIHATPVLEVPVGISEDELKQEILAELGAGDPGITDANVNDLSAGELRSEGDEGEAVVAAPAEDEGLQLSEELTVMGKIEAVLFASPKPLRTVEIHELIMDQGYSLKETQDALDELTEFYRDRAGGFHLKYIKRMGYQFQTTSAAKSLMEKQFSSRPRPLSRASLETLAVVAYRQKNNKAGVTRAEVEFIRGVDAGSIFKTLVERNLLTCIGRKEIPGRPMMFGVTDEFLKVFQLGSINDLPPLESFQTPSDVINAANEKIAQFEAEQEGVNPEDFIGDEAYTENLGDSEFDILAAEANPYAPTLDRIEEIKHEVEASDIEERALDTIPADILAEMAEESFYDSSESDKEAARIEAQSIAVPAVVIEGMASELIDRMEEGEIGFEVAAPDSITEVERELEGASLAVETDDSEWDEPSASDQIIPEPAPEKSDESLFGSEDGKQVERPSES